MSEDAVSELLHEVRSLRADMAKLSAGQSALLRREGLRLTRDQACARLKIHRNTLAQMIKDKRFPAPMKDGHWLEATVVEWESAQEQKGH